MVGRHLLVVEDDKLVRFSLKVLLESEGFYVDVASNGDDAWNLLVSKNYSMVLCDINLPGKDGREILEQTRANGIETDLLLFTGYGNISDAVECIKNGAYDYFTKPIDNDRLIATIRRALARKGRVRSKRSGSENAPACEPFPCEACTSMRFKSKVMKDLYRNAGIAAKTEANILITGRSGTGKTMLAKLIHSQSSRRSNPFVEVSCGALSENLLESELFGHKKGSFTGAASDKVGKFEAARDGTVFLDDINSASVGLQVRLLRIIEEKVFERVGDVRTIHTNARIVAATNQDLLELSRNMLFREDLYHRLNVIGLELPSLRERKEDIPVLVDHFIERSSIKHKKVVAAIRPDALDALVQYDWPGNVRELENIIERAVIFSRESEIGCTDLPRHIAGKGKSEPPRPEKVLELSAAIHKYEKIHIFEALQVNMGNRMKTAISLGISRATLFNKMRKHGLI